MCKWTQLQGEYLKNEFNADYDKLWNFEMICIIC